LSIIPEQEEVMFCALYQIKEVYKIKRPNDFHHSVGMPMTGQLSNHFVEGIRKIYELEPFIKLETLLTEEGKKGSKIYKRAV
jgi:hypothetical protein